MRERRYLSVVALRKEDYERLGVNGTQEGAGVPLLLAKHKRLMAFVNDLLFLVVAEVTLSYIRCERRDGPRSRIIYSVCSDYAKNCLFIAVYLSLFPIPWSGKEPASRFHFNGILIRR